MEGIVQGLKRVALTAGWHSTQAKFREVREHTLVEVDQTPAAPGLARFGWEDVEGHERIRTRRTQSVFMQISQRGEKSWSKLPSSSMHDPETVFVLAEPKTASWITGLSAFAGFTCLRTRDE